MNRILLLAALAAAFLSAPASANADKTVAILGLEVKGGADVDKETILLAKELSDKLRAQPAMLGGPYKLAPGVSKGLAEMKLLAGCDDEGNSCMATIGSALGSDAMLYGKLVRNGDVATVSLQLLDVRAKRKLRGVTDSIPKADWESLDTWAGSLYARVVGVPFEGTVLLSSNATTGTVFVDGEMKTSLTGGAVTLKGLSAGRHRLAVESPGYKRWAGEVNIAPGKTANVRADLDAVSSTAGPMDSDTGGTSATKVAFWASLGVSAAAASVQLVNWFVLRKGALDDKDAAFGRLSESRGTTNSEYDAIVAAAPGSSGNRIDDVCAPANSVLNDSPSPSSDLRALVNACDDGDRTAVISYTAGGVAIVAGAAAAFFFYKGYIAAEGSDEESSTVRLTPTVTPNTGGAGLSIEF